MKKILILLFTFSSLATFSQNTPEEFYRSGMEKRDNKDYIGSILDFTKAIKLDNYETVKFVYYARGVSYYLLGNKSDACYDFEMSSRLGYDYAEKMIRELCD